MNRLHIMLYDRKRFVCAAAMAAVFLLLAGGANALANTVWCVPHANLNPACTALTTKPHIQDAVSAAASQDVIVVGPGYYNETVAIGIPNLTIMGAQAGRDARVDRHDSSKESVVDASGSPPGSGGGAAFLVQAQNVIVDGFTIEGGTNGATANASGIFVYGVSSTQILNNIIQNNAVGVCLYSGSGTLVEHNLFQANNEGAAGSTAPVFAGMAGFGIAGAGTAMGAITENEFKGNRAAAMDLNGAAYEEVTKNTSKNDGSFAVFDGFAYVFFSHNQGQDFGAQGFLPIPLTSPAGGHADAAIDVTAGTDLQINDNDLEEGKTTGYSGIAFTTIFGGSPCENCPVSNNRIKRFAANGIVAEAGADPPPVIPGTLQASSISGNDVEENGNVGILIEGSPANSGNSVVDNEAEHNHTNDCEDETNLIPSGTGTAGTYNTWFNNLGSLSLPAGLCAPGSGHHHD
jgi:parallel beta-helix repeat protein